jgi:hypothetical protein
MNSSLKREDSITQAFDVPGMKNVVNMLFSSRNPQISRHELATVLLRLIDLIGAGSTSVVTDSIAGGADYPLAVSDASLLTHMVFLVTDGNPAPTLTVTEQGAEILLLNVPFDQDDSTVWIAAFSRAHDATLVLSPNCNVNFRAYFSPDVT